MPNMYIFIYSISKFAYQLFKMFPNQNQPNGTRLTARCPFTGPKMSRIPGPDPLQVTFVMDLSASKAGPYKSRSINS